MTRDIKLVLVYSGVLFLVVVGVIQLWLWRGANSTTYQPELTVENPVAERVPLQIGDTRLMVEVRDTDEERALGLSGRTELGATYGMVFIFEYPGQPVFWMKEMQFSLDIIWVRNGEVVQIDEEVPHPTERQPQVATVSPRVPIDTVIEVVAGFVENNGIAVGDRVMRN
jgi:uncharacterized protein